MKQNAKIRGLYAITPDELDTTELLRKTELVLKGGARVIQYRNKIANEALRVIQAQALRLLTKHFDATLIINDDAQLAVEVDADGVHLGATDGEVLQARELLGNSKIIGISCYNDLILARNAVNLGADYVAFGAFFCSNVKPDAARAELDLLRQAKCQLSVPLVAIGGITADNAASVLEAGASALAVITAVFDAVDVQASAAKFLQFFVQEPKS
jgi:thiamine-phosphate pyrophosphorylase